MKPVIVIPPDEEPLTVDEALVHCRFDEADDELRDQIAMQIGSARRSAESELRRYLITQTLDAYFDSWPSAIKLPPAQSVTSITYVDYSGVTQTLSADQYIVDTKSIPARITPAYGVSWPSVRAQMNAITVRFVAGYGEEADVPQCIKIWMLQRIKTAIDNPGGVVTGTIVSPFPRSYVDGLLDPERVQGRI